MKVKLICQQCFQESITNEKRIDEDAFRDPFFYHSAHDLTDDGVIEYCCKLGHKNYCFVQNPKYELLFDIGFSAYKDGYYREACLDFAACIERFHEYCVFSILCKTINTDELEKMWKIISKQSERQYGAFVALYTNIIGEAPQSISVSSIEFRNDITHKGKLPSKDETLKYARNVSDYIKSVFQILETKVDMMLGLLPRIVPLMKEKKNTTSLCIPTIISSVCQGRTFEESINAYEKMFEIVYE